MTESMIVTDGLDLPAAQRYARAAIEAMREPTERMLAEANRLNHPRDAEIYSAMIDAALKWPAGSADRAGVPLARD